MTAVTNQVKNINNNNLDLTKLASPELISRLKTLVAHERRITADVIDHIKEVGRRRLYLDEGFVSLFDYLTKGLGYSNASAQRRIDAARLIQELPELKEDLRSGAVQLMQLSVVAQSLRQKQKECPELKLSINDKKELVELAKNQDLVTTQKLVAQHLDLEVKQVEKQRVQQDDSLRIEMTLSRQDQDELQRVRELVSHVHPHLNWRELMVFLAQDYLKRKDPLRPRLSNQNRDQADSAMALQPLNAASSSMNAELDPPKEPTQSRNMKPLPVSVKRFVFRRDRCCQWRDAKTGQQCHSRFQLEVDHKIPRWAGGGNTPENLQLLCDTHNRLKYQKEAGLRDGEIDYR